MQDVMIRHRAKVAALGTAAVAVAALVGLDLVPLVEAFAEGAGACR